MEVKLYVGNLDFSTTADDLRTLFAQAGSVATVDVIKDRDTGQSKGFAFVTMTDQVEAQKAITMFNDFPLGDREMKVNPAKPREERNGVRPRGGAFGNAGPGNRGHKARGGNRRY
jgi:RNA recognition motif-containing protein